MTRKTKYILIILLILSSVFASGCTYTRNSDQQLTNEINEQEQSTWIDTFHPEECDFSPTGENKYFLLNPGYQLTLEGFDEDNNSVALIITVLNVTRIIGNIETGVVEEREFVNGEPEEISWNFFAVCKQTQDIYYFGEEVDIYYEGEVVSHEGAWKAGSDGAKAGLMMPGTIQSGYKYYQEIAPDIAMDRAEIKSDDEMLNTPAGTFTSCLKVEETTPLEPSAIEYKIYAPGIGLVKDEELVLTQYGFIDLNNFTAYITRQYAGEIAAGAANGTVTEVTTEEKDGRTVYTVRLVSDNRTSNVTIDAHTAKIVTIQKSLHEGQPVVESTQKITEQQAKEIALNAVNGTVTGVELERTVGKLVYVVEIKSGYVEKDVIIDISTGEIIRIET